MFDNYIVAKSGSELRYIERNFSNDGSVHKGSKMLNLTPGEDVWVENIAPTGVKDLV